MPNTRWNRFISLKSLRSRSRIGISLAKIAKIAKQEGEKISVRSIFSGLGDHGDLGESHFSFFSSSATHSGPLSRPVSVIPPTLRAAHL